MKTTKTASGKKIPSLAGYLCLSALAGLCVLAGCGHFGGIYGPSSYTVEDLAVDREYARTEVLQGYRDYAGKVIRVSPLVAGNWVDYSKVLVKDLNLLEPGPYQITVSMSVLAEKADAARTRISAYRPTEMTVNTPSQIKWNGPANIGWTIQNGYDYYAQFGGKAVEVPVGEWVDLKFSQAFEFTSIENMQIALDGHNDQQGLIDLVLYVRHFTVQIRTSAALIALTFEDGPSDFTQFLLDKLDEHGVKATFFVSGMGIDAAHSVYDRSTAPADRPEIALDRHEVLKRIVEDGHEIANFSYSGNYLGGGSLDGIDGVDSRITKDSIPVLRDYTVADYPLSEAAIRRELEDTQTAIQKAVYGDAYLNFPPLSKYVRMPFAPDYSRAANFKKVAEEMGLLVIGGTELAYDRSSDSDADRIADQILETISPWGISVNKDPRADASIIRVLDSLLPKLKTEGYLFVTLSEMAAKRGSPVIPGNLYDSFDPDLDVPEEEE